MARPGFTAPVNQFKALTVQRTGSGRPFRASHSCPPFSNQPCILKRPNRPALNDISVVSLLCLMAGSCTSSKMEDDKQILKRTRDICKSCGPSPCECPQLLHEHILFYALSLESILTYCCTAQKTCSEQFTTETRCNLSLHSSSVPVQRMRAMEQNKTISAQS